MFDGVIARTPIFNRALEVFGYELKLGVGSANQDLGQCLVDASCDIRLEELTGEHPALIRLPTATLGRCDDLRWPKDKIVLAVSAPTITSPEESDQISHLANEGYTIALHNQWPDAGPASAPQFSDLFRMFALDATISDRLPAVPGRRGARPHASLMVRELENSGQYEHSVKLGFDYFEGAFFERPRLLHGTEIPGDRISVLQLIARLQDPNVEIGEVERLVSRDLTLSYKLLRLINAAYFGIPKRVESIRRAVVFFGLERIKNWATVLLVNAIDFKPRELLTTALVRAKACQLLAEDLGLHPTEPFYMSGLFSILDAIMDAPMEKILERLNLADPINSALLQGAGPQGEVLNTVLAYERTEASGWQHLPFSNCNIPMRSYLSGIGWAAEFTRQIQGPGK